MDSSKVSTAKATIAPNSRYIGLDHASKEYILQPDGDADCILKSSTEILSDRHLLQLPQMNELVSPLESLIDIAADMCLTEKFDAGIVAPAATCSDCGTASKLIRVSDTIDDEKVTESLNQDNSMFIVTALEECDITPHEPSALTNSASDADLMNSSSIGDMSSGMKSSLSLDIGSLEIGSCSSIPTTPTSTFPRYTLDPNLENAGCISGALLAIWDNIMGPRVLGLWSPVPKICPLERDISMLDADGGSCQSSQVP